MISSFVFDLIAKLIHLSGPVWNKGIENRGMGKNVGI
jgi:hypothetical protein